VIEYFLFLELLMFLFTFRQWKSVQTWNWSSHLPPSMPSNSRNISLRLWVHAHFYIQLNSVFYCLTDGHRSDSTLFFLSYTQASVCVAVK